MILSDKYSDDCISDIQSKYERKVDMSIIKTHDITSCGGKDDIVLRPLSNEHFPYLYKWNADPEVLYWSERSTENPNVIQQRSCLTDLRRRIAERVLLSYRGKRHCDWRVLASEDEFA